MRIEVRVTPRSARPRVGGSVGGALVVAVAEPAVEGRATEASRRALASAFGVRARQVELVSGATSRTKVFEVAGEPEALAARLAELLGN